MTAGVSNVPHQSAGRNFSVLMPSFIALDSPTRVEQLRAAIMSITEQKFDGCYEIIIIDDGSPKPIIDLLAGTPLVAQANIRIVRQYRSNGLVQALNRGLSEARFDLIARLDDDDVWLPGKIKQQLERFAADPDLTILGTGMSLIFESGDPPVDHIRSDGWTPILQFFCEGGCPFPHGSILARKDIFNLLGRYPQAAAARHCEDYWLWSSWVRFFKPGMIEKVFLNYSVSARSISSVHATRNREISQRICRDFIKLDINSTVPTAVNALAEVLGITVLQAGVLAYRLWYFGATASLPKQAVGPLQALMPDRSIFFENHSPSTVSIPHLLKGFGAHEASCKGEMIILRFG